MYPVSREEQKCNQGLITTYTGIKKLFTHHYTFRYHFLKCRDIFAVALRPKRTSQKDGCYPMAELFLGLVYWDKQQTSRHAGTQL